jgi:hypothetical protein
LLAFIAAFWSAAMGCQRAQRLAAERRIDNAALAEHEQNLADATLCALAAMVTTGFFLSLAYHPMTFFILGVSVAVATGSPRVWRKAGLR